MSTTTEAVFSSLKNSATLKVLVLRLYGEMKTSLVNNLLDSMNRSVQGGLYAGLV